MFSYLKKTIKGNSIHAHILRSNLFNFSMFLLIIIIAILALAVINHKSKNFITNEIPGVVGSYKLLTNIHETNRLLNLWILKNEKYISEAQNLIWKKGIYDEINALQSISPESTKEIEKIKQAINQLRIKQWQVTDLAHMPGNNRALDLYTRKLTRIKDNFFNNISQIINKLGSDTENNHNGQLLLPLYLAAEIRGYFILSNTKLVEFVINGKIKTLNQYVQSANTTDILLKKLLKNSSVLSAPKKLLLNDLMNLFYHYQKLAKNIINIRQLPTWNFSNHILETELVPLNREIINMINALVLVKKQKSEQSSNNIIHIGNTLIFAFMVSSFLLLWLTLIITKRNTSSFTEPLINLDKATHQFADNILRYDITPQGSDEIQSLAISFNQMRYKIEKHQKELMTSNERLEIANKAKDTFLSSMSHEFRTPLNAIIGFSDLMIMMEKKNNTLNDDSLCIVINQAGHTMLRLINESLEMVNMDSIEPAIKTFDLNQLITSIIHELTPKATVHNIELTFEPVIESISSITTAPNYLKKILVNIIDNAITYNLQKGKVWIYCKQPDQYRLRINVSDNGKGLTEQYVSRLFIPYDRLDQEGIGPSGLGLGLAKSKILANKLNMQLGASCRENEGCTFYIDLMLNKSSYYTGTSET